VTGKGLDGRREAGLMLVLTAVVVGTLLVLLTVASPHSMGPQPEWYESPVIWLGIVGVAFGFGWMIRIYRSTLDAEARPSSWRSRSR
jgi:hypothetical protein